MINRNVRIYNCAVSFIFYCYMLQNKQPHIDTHYAV